ncbi:porin [Massilia sp. CCM 8734]|uniref:porin n=1 Tax=Massilia sp. CCM 8734 TaxID=2609283 RepID=UPI001423E4E0|nr:porin [Massilia sp. CCM 8734]
MAAVVSGALASPAMAQGSITVGGVLDTGFMSVSNIGEGSQSKIVAGDGIMGMSHVGVRGKEDLGGGVNAVFTLQAGIKPSKGSQTSTGLLFSRNAYVGLDGALGTLTVGRQWGFNDDWMVGSVFMGGYHAGGVFKLTEFEALSAVYDNTIKYVTPTVGGLQGGAMYGLGEVAGKASAGSMYNLALRYAQGPFYMVASYAHEEAANASASVYTVSTVGASYSVGAWRARLGYAASDIGGPGKFQSIISLPKSKASVVEAGVDYTVSSAFTMSGNVVYRENKTFSNKTTVLRWLGRYTLSSRTSLIANVAYLSNADGATEALVNNSSPLAGLGGAIADQSQTGIALGIIHSF